jgi:predicted flap endonuclease-1-like 5' DNA nuclease
MSNSTLIIVGAAILVLALVLFLLARTGRKPIEGPVEGSGRGGIADQRGLDASTEFSPVTPDEPLPEPGAGVAAGISAAEYAAEPGGEAIPDGPPDALTRMKGLGPKAEALLQGLGITRYAQIAAWTPADVARIDPQMGAFKGRIVRDRWVEQARFLAQDDVAGFEGVFGKLG